jgi:hypothetical protein
VGPILATRNNEVMKLCRSTVIAPGSLENVLKPLQNLSEEHKATWILCQNLHVPCTLTIINNALMNREKQKNLRKKTINVVTCYNRNSIYTRTAADFENLTFSGMSDVIRSVLQEEVLPKNKMMMMIIIIIKKIIIIIPIIIVPERLVPDTLPFFRHFCFVSVLIYSHTFI